MASHGSVAIVTGAAGGIGYAISDVLLREGYKVCLSDINAERGTESLAVLQKKYAADRVIFLQCDVASKSSFEDVFARTRKEFGRIDVVVNNAGIMDETNPQRMMDINFMGTVHGCEIALKYMGTKNGGQGGAVINVSSLGGVVPHPSIPVYIASKHATVGFTRSYGNKVHFGENGVIFMAICPHFVKTPLLHSAKPLMELDQALFSALLEPESVADGVLKLLEDKRNGSALIVLSGGCEYTELQGRLKEIHDSTTKRA